MFNPYYPWGAPQTPVVFVPPTAPPPNNTPPHNFTSWKDVQAYAKKEAKREAKLRLKWEEEAKKKKDGDKNKDAPKKAMIPFVEGLVLMVLISPFIGLPTLKIYQMIFQLWGSALGVK